MDGRHTMLVTLLSPVHNPTYILPSTYPIYIAGIELPYYLEWELNVDPVTLLGPVHTPLTFYHPHTQHILPALHCFQPCNV
jgi:hypothetical protein